MRRKRHKAQVNHERWLVSYADFITLLFAFFVVLFASSHADRAKARQVSEAVKAAFGGPSPSGANGTGPSNMTSGSSHSLAPALKQLIQTLKPEIKAGTMQVRMDQRGLIVSLNEATFFPSGEDAVDPATWTSVGKVAAAIRDLPNSVRTEGHTDSIPIHTARFRDNWDLSAARAIAVMELLRDRWNIPRERLAITGYADNNPLDSNLTEQGRARNRRVDIVILNSVGESMEPVK